MTITEDGGSYWNRTTPTSRRIATACTDDEVLATKSGSIRRPRHADFDATVEICLTLMSCASSASHLRSASAEGPAVVGISLGRLTYG